MTDIVILLKGYSLEAYQEGLYTRSNRLLEAAQEIERLREEVGKSEYKWTSREKDDSEGVLAHLDALKARVDALENQQMDSINKALLFENSEYGRKFDVMKEALEPFFATVDRLIKAHFTTDEISDGEIFVKAKDIINAWEVYRKVTADEKA